MPRLTFAPTARPQPRPTLLHRLHPLALACLLASQAPVLAQTSPAAPAAVQTRSFTLPAGPLAETLSRIGRESGQAIVADPALLAGQNAPALNGSFTAQAAVEQVLAGTRLQVERLPNGVLQVRPAPPQPVGGNVDTLSAVTVTADRLGGELIPSTQPMTVIEGDELDELRAISPNLNTLLTKVVPGLSDASRNLTDFGMTLRGRNALVLVDGIPLNLNRNSARDLVNIDPSQVERIEVVRGSNALYGSGGSGGIIAITTRRPGGATRVQTTVGFDTSLTRIGHEGMGGQLQQLVSGGDERFDYELDLTARHTGGGYDAHGRRIAPDASQGDMFDANTYSLGAKLGWHLDDTQRVQLAAQYLRAHQHTDYASDPSVNRLPLGEANARAITGLDLANQNQIENRMLSLSYENRDLAGSTLSALAYVRHNDTRFGPSDSRTNTNRGNFVDQVRQENRIYGGRLTLDTPLGADSRVIWGADYIQERSRMPLEVMDPALYDASGGLTFVKIGEVMYLPWTTTRSTGVFAQGQHRFNAQWSVEGGVRYERAQASVNRFQPLSQSRLANPATVAGGKVNYDAVLYNAGIAYEFLPGQETYASFSQGFDLPDVGLQLRNAGAGFDLGSSELEPVKTDNYELGWRGRLGADTHGTFTVFHSRSALGAIQSFNNGLRLTRTRERIHGVEATLDWYGDAWSAGGTFTWMQGRETPQGASESRLMTGYRIPPVKVTGYVQYQPSDRWQVRAQLTWFGSRDYRLADSRTQFARADVKGYATVDLSGRYAFDDRRWVTVGIQNLFNRDYLPLYSQLMRSGNNNSRLPAAGTVLMATYTQRW